MQASLLRELVSRRFAIRARWEALLRAEPVTTPLGLPDALVHLIDTTLEEIFASLAERSHETATHGDDSYCADPLCHCGRNPYLAYFGAADQAMREALILSQVASAPLDPVERDASLEELNGVLKQISGREIEAFCGVCQFRHLALQAPVQTLAINGG
jgi:hypothetical protein